MVKEEKYIEFHNLSNTFNIIRPFSKQPVAFIKYATNTAHLIGAKPSKRMNTCHIFPVFTLPIPRDTLVPFT